MCEASGLTKQAWPLLPEMLRSSLPTALFEGMGHLEESNLREAGGTGGGGRGTERAGGGSGRTMVRMAEGAVPPLPTASRSSRSRSLAGGWSWPSAPRRRR